MTNTFPISEENINSWQRKMDAVARYMLLGNLRVVAEQLEMSYNTLSEWKRQPWWADMVETLRKQKKQKKADSLNKIIENGIEILQDRLEYGDYVLNQKTGEIVRKPIGAKETNVIVNQLLQRQNELEEAAEKYSAQEENVQDTLASIAKAFQKITRQINKEDATTVNFVEIVENKDALHDEWKTRLQTGEREIQQ